MTCGDVYILAAPPGCGNVYAYPSQIHPVTPTRRHRGGFAVKHPKSEKPPIVDDEIAIAMALMELL